MTPSADTPSADAPSADAPRAVPPKPKNIVERLAHGYWQDIGPAQRAGLLSWAAFATTFGVVRAITYSIRAGRGPVRNLSLGGEHIHHYVWGIATLAGVGGIAVRGVNAAHRHPTLAIAYGSGLALIVDEFALLLDLQDVYWAKQGRKSVDVAIGIIATAGCYFAAAPFWKRIATGHR
jgi:hypothetical protein